MFNLVVFCAIVISLTNLSWQDAGQWKAGVGLVGTYSDIITGFVNHARKNEIVTDKVTFHSLVGRKGSKARLYCSGMDSWVHLEDEETLPRKFNEGRDICCKFEWQDQRGQTFTLNGARVGRPRGGGGEDINIYMYGYGLYTDKISNGLAEGFLTLFNGRMEKFANWYGLINNSIGCEPVVKREKSKECRGNSQYGSRYDQWCQTNCAQNNCSPAHCACN